MAADMVAVMQRLGFPRFRLAGHDRGGRVSHRLALDHPQAVEKLAVLDIIPTRTLFETVNQQVATGYYHWFFLIQSFDMPERMIGSDPEYYLRRKTGERKSVVEGKSVSVRVDHGWRRNIKKKKNIKSKKEQLE